MARFAHNGTNSWGKPCRFELEKLDLKIARTLSP